MRIFGQQFREGVLKAPLDLSALTAEVTAQETVEGGASTLITQLLAEVQANINDPVALAALVQRGAAANAALASAIATVPPAQPAPSGGV